MRGAALLRGASMVSTLGLAACPSLIGVTDLPPGPDASTDAPVSEASVSEAGVADSGAESGDDGPGPTCEAGPCPQVLASGLGCPRFLAVDANNVYWTDNAGPDVGGVDQCLRTGCGGKPIHLSTNENGAAGIALDAENVYWVDFNAGSVRSCAIGGCSGVPSTLNGGPTLYGPFGLARAGSLLYVGAPNNSALVDCPTSGCPSGPASVLTYGTYPYGPFDVAVDSSNVYFSTNEPTGMVGSCPLAGCPGGPVVLADGQDGVAQLALYGGYVYWVTTGHDVDVARCATQGCGDQPTLLYTGSGAGAQSVLGSGVAVDATGVYWADGSDGTIKSCPSDGCNGQPPKVLASGLVNPSGVVVDQDSIYFATFNYPNCNDLTGTVQRLAK